MSTPKVVLKGWSQVEEELGILGELMAEQKQIDGRMKAEIAKITGDYAVQLSDIDTAIKTKEMLIEQFTRHNMEDIRGDGKMTQKFTTGVIKTKKVDDIDYPGNDELVELLRQAGLKQYIDIVEKPMKSAIKAAAQKDETLYEKLSIDITPTISVKIKPYF